MEDDDVDVLGGCDSPTDQTTQKASASKLEKLLDSGNSPYKRFSSIQRDKGEKVIKLRSAEDDRLVDVVEVSKIPVLGLKRTLPSKKLEATDSVCSSNSSQSFRKSSPKRTENIEERLKIIFSLPKPTHFKVIDPEIVLNEEEILFPEFFGAGRNQQALLQRYLQIRSHMISVWNTQKPKYVTKSMVRQGLRNCSNSDVLVRIHAYLEQKGIINYGCDECHYASQAESDNFKQNVLLSGGNVEVDSIKHLEKDVWHNPLRKRKKKAEEDDMTGDGKNYTFAHEENGLIHLAHISNELTIQQEKKLKMKNQAMTLVHCKHFQTPPYKIVFHLQCYLIVEVHCHASCNLEIMGLLGGKFRPDNKEMEILACVPCYVLSSTTVHCDMCPVSQCEAKEMIELEGLDVVGWYHSHPASMPEPSPQDITSQDMYQSHFAHSSAPFVGLIMSPYSHYNPKFFILSKNEPYEIQFDLSFKMRVNTVEMRNQMCSTLTKVTELTPFGKTIPKKSRTYLETCRDHFQKVLTKSKMDTDEQSAILTTINDVLTYSEDEAIFNIEVLE